MRTLRLTIRYDGSGYAGWQVQPGQRTIQGVIEDALCTIFKGPCRITGAGRTDAGVHALGQVAHLKTDSLIPPPNLGKALNSLLPPDLLIRQVEEAEGLVLPQEPERFGSKDERYFRVS